MIYFRILYICFINRKFLFSYFWLFIRQASQFYFYLGHLTNFIYSKPWNQPSSKPTLTFSGLQQIPVPYFPYNCNFHPNELSLTTLPVLAFCQTTRWWFGAFEVKQCKYVTDVLNNSKSFSGTLLGNACLVRQ
jgi:hypothetical protein